MKPRIRGKVVLAEATSRKVSKIIPVLCHSAASWHACAHARGILIDEIIDERSNRFLVSICYQNHPQGDIRIAVGFRVAYEMEFQRQASSV